MYPDAEGNTDRKECRSECNVNSHKVSARLSNLKILAIYGKTIEKTTYESVLCNREGNHDPISD